MGERSIEFAPEARAGLGRILEWLVESGSSDGEITLDTDLIDNEVLTSLKFVELILLVEEVRGGEIPDAERELERFRTLRRIATHYLS